MPNLTTRLNLVKPLTTEAYDVGVHNGNMDLLDAAPGNATICTSGTRPSVPDDGDMIFETDTNNLLTRHSSSWKATNGRVFLCTAGTRPSSSVSFGGMMIFEQDTGNRLIRSSGNTLWLPQSPYSVADATERGALTSLYQGFVIWRRDTHQFEYLGDDGNWYVINAPHEANIQAASGATSSTSYTATLTGATACSMTFIAPRSGRVVLVDTAQISNNTSAVYGFVCSRVGTGLTIGGGSAILTPSDDEALVWNSTTVAGRMSVLHPISGLSAGAAYNIQQQYKVSGAGSVGTFVRRQIILMVSN